MEDAVHATLRWPVIKRKWDLGDKDDYIWSIFGAPFIVITDLWEEVEPFIDNARTEHKHLLWAFVFLKIYSPLEKVHYAIVGLRYKQTFSKWWSSWYFVKKICNLQDDVLVGIDCPCSEPHLFSTDVLPKKFNRLRIKYRIGICIETGYIVWINGFFSGRNSEMIIFWGELTTILEDLKFVKADTSLQGYNKEQEINKMNWIFVTGYKLVSFLKSFINSSFCNFT